MRPALLCATALAFAGCGPAGFSQLGEFQFQFMYVGDSLSQGWLAYDDSQVGCKTLDQDFTATMNGSPASVFRGAPDHHLFRNTNCIFPSISFPRPQAVNDSVLLVASAAGEQLTVQAQGIGFALAGVPLVTMRSTFCLASSPASCAKRSRRPSPQRYSICRFCPST